MPIIDSRELATLLSNDEESRLDFKQVFNLRTSQDKKEFSKDICAIANYVYQNGGKGHIIVGVQDRTRIPVGLGTINFREERLQQIVKTRAEPPPIFKAGIVTHGSVNLGIIQIIRSPSGPHKWMNKKYPIRRGSTTDYMSPLEVIQTISTRVRRVMSADSEYSILGRTTRFGVIFNDLHDSLIELGLNERYFERPQLGNRENLKVAKVINGRRYNLYFFIYPDRLDTYRYRFLNNVIWDSLADIIPRHRSIFFILIHGTFRRTPLNRSLEYGGNRTIIPIANSTLYFGPGLGMGEDRSFFSHLPIPKFYLSNIKSKTDTKTRLELILNWIVDNDALFVEIREALQSERDRKKRMQRRQKTSRVTFTRV